VPWLLLLEVLSLVVERGGGFGRSSEVRARIHTVRDTVGEKAHAKAKERSGRFCICIFPRLLLDLPFFIISSAQGTIGSSARRRHPPGLTRRGLLEPASISLWRDHLPFKLRTCGGCVIFRMGDAVVGIIGMGDMGKMYARRISDAGWR